MQEKNQAVVVFYVAMGGEARMGSKNQVAGSRKPVKGKRGGVSSGRKKVG